MRRGFERFEQPEDYHSEPMQRMRPGGLLSDQLIKAYMARPMVINRRKMVHDMLHNHSTVHYHMRGCRNLTKLRKGYYDHITSPSSPRVQDFTVYRADMKDYSRLLVVACEAHKRGDLRRADDAEKELLRIEMKYGF